MSEQVIRFSGWDCIVQKSTYKHNDQLAIKLVGANTEHNQKEDVFHGEAIATVTVCLPHLELEKNQTLISWKDGMLEAMVKNNIVEDLNQTFPSGHCHVHLVEVLI
jgi:hypothetical protein